MRTHTVRAYRYSNGDVRAFGIGRGRRRVRAVLVNFGGDCTGEQLGTLRLELLKRCNGVPVVVLALCDTDYGVADLMTRILQKEGGVQEVWSESIAAEADKAGGG